MSAFLKRRVGGALIVCAIASLVLPAIAQSVPPNPQPDATLRSTPQTVVWGYISADLPPALTIKSGQTVKIDTVSHQGLLTKDPPVTFFGAGGIPPEQVLQDATDIYHMVSHVNGLGAHVLTGPIYVEGAMPGDMLEVRIHKFDFRVPYGVNNSGPRTGVLGELLTAPTPKIIKLDLNRNVALFSKDIEVPLSPFLGVMAVAPPRDLLLVNSRPPARWGGNMDLNKLAAGATLYLPVFNAGAQFLTGDPHAAQGDGEISGTAIECSMTGTFEVILHKKGELSGRPFADLSYPLIETETEWVLTGFSHPNYLAEFGTQGQSEVYAKSSLDLAMKDAFRKMRRFLMNSKGLSEDEAIALMSSAVDFGVTQVVDGNWGVHAILRKSVFEK
jgi:acetamidase/formamidase